ncbi:UbiA-like protein EboC [Flavobacterium sp. Fl-77]|uniref:UbiA-like protein EboC n=1 Tax=Flavobacterium flavipigmentatum TaxID=2893884 RepID=A0AAJ2SHS4_9FLAO|nr:MULTISPECIES: UbiA-like protein EboC [unclassified Flavobacterium]MDX6183407.1 UbiA-like protein EboC [Flavobacterium sp. Fl-33]MDX6186691.1 UbiA-like protein EboC [Flavobacterium sp. Fl-77]UFH38541.1 UbiA-like protein EboC [Flavobacterium sp. F-70]
MSSKPFYLLTLMRPANIITAIADILAGIAISGVLVFTGNNGYFLLDLLLLVFSTIGLYGGGIVFNDIFDLESDIINRPERVLPRGLVRKKEAILLGCLLLLMGIGFAFAVSTLSGVLAIIISILALSYDKISKHYPVIGPLNMGLCRGGNLLLGMSINNDTVFNYWYIGIIPILFIAAITLTAKKEAAGNNKSTLLIAMFLDAAVVALFVWIGHLLGFRFWILMPFLLFWYGINFFAKYKAFVYNRPHTIQKAVKTGILSLIPLNASYVAGSAGLFYALLVLALLPVSILLSKKFAVT